MNHDYRDIIDLIPQAPKWWDEHAVPRYSDFGPREVANIYADEMALLLIECQDCGKEYEVCISRTRHQTLDCARALASFVKDGDLHYGDPPNACDEGCRAGATMNSVPQRVLEFWKRDVPGDFVRVPSLEVAIDVEWAR